MGIVALVLLVCMVVEYCRERWRTFVPLSAFHDGPADDYELAMLTEGRDLVVLVALLNLDACEALELARTGFRVRLPWERREHPLPIVASVGWLHPPTHPVERAVYRAALAGMTSEERIRADRQVAVALDELTERLVAAGLLVPQPPPPALAEPERHPNFRPRTLVGHELVRRLRRDHPVESVGTLVALFGDKMLSKVDDGLVRARARATARAQPRWSTIGLSALGDSGWGGGEDETGGSW